MAVDLDHLNEGLKRLKLRRIRELLTSDDAAEHRQGFDNPLELEAL